MSLRLWLIRHGESTWNAIGRVQGWADPPLSEKGKWQAERVAERLVVVPFTALYTSTLQRAYQTAHIIANNVGLVPVQDSRLREHGMGEATGMQWGREAFLTRWPHLTELANQGKPIRTHIPGAEPSISFVTRVTAAMHDIRQAHPVGDVAVVAHGGVFRAYLMEVFGASSGRAEFSFDNVSVSMLEVTEMSFARLRFLNDCSHLVGKETSE